MKDPRAFFEDNLELIDRTSAAICGRFGCRGEDAEDFASIVRLKLLEDDCARLGKFRGRSRASTFLTFVVTNLFRDYRNQLWGKWRSSTMAKRLGEEAMLLERLTTRDGRSIDESVEILIAHYKAEMSRQELWAIWRQLPEKPKRRFVAVEEIAEMMASDQADSRAEESEAKGFRGRLTVALREVFQELPEQDRLLLRLSFEGALSIAKIARSLGEKQRLLYYRREIACQRLRAALEARGFRAREALQSIGREGWQSDSSKIIFGSVYGEEGRRASQEENGSKTEDPPRARNPRRLRRRRAPGGGEEADRRASGQL